MTDYNDGEWHIHKSGPCPVHPETVINRIYANDFDDIFEKDEEVEAGEVDWAEGVVFFRVVTPYVEPVKPREWWAVGHHLRDTQEAAEDFRDLLCREWPDSGFEKYHIIHVCEVIE